MKTKNLSNEMRFQDSSGMMISMILSSQKITNGYFSKAFLIIRKWQEMFGGIK